MSHASQLTICMYKYHQPHLQLQRKKNSPVTDDKVSYSTNREWNIMKLLRSCKIYIDSINTYIESEMLHYIGPHCNKVIFLSEEHSCTFSHFQAALYFNEQYKADNFHSLQ